MKRGDKIRFGFMAAVCAGITARHLVKLANEDPKDDDPEKENLRRAAKGIVNFLQGKPKPEPITSSVYGPQETKHSYFKLSMKMHRDDDPLPTKDDGTKVCPPRAAGLPFDW